MSIIHPLKTTPGFLLSYPRTKGFRTKNGFLKLKETMLKKFKGTRQGWWLEVVNNISKALTSMKPIRL